MSTINPTDGPQYSAFTGLIYVFNVIVGTGALAIPGVVAKAGIILSAVVLVILAFVSYITVTFMIEAMSISNAILNNSEEETNNEEDDPLLQTTSQLRTTQNTQNKFSIIQRVEMGSMARQFFAPPGIILFYSCLAIYLYGDLAIYITAVSKSLRDVTCALTNTTENPLESCPFDLTPLEVYRLYTLIFIIVIGPLTYFKISKTKYLQLTTTVLRWCAFILMIILAIIKIPTNTNQVPLFNMKQLPSLIGVSIYSFMCHHSLPSLVTPITNHSFLSKLFLLDYCLISIFYLLLSVTGVYAFYPNINDLYTLNFIQTDPNGFFSFLLALFPVFTLTTNFPIISITLKNNLKTILNSNNNFICTLLTILPPFIVSIFIQDVQLLVNFTGSYAGAGIQYITPTLLVFIARKQFNEHNPYASPFKHSAWILAVAIFTLSTISLVTIHLIYT